MLHNSEGHPLAQCTATYDIPTADAEAAWSRLASKLEHGDGPDHLLAIGELDDGERVIRGSVYRLEGRLELEANSSERLGAQPHHGSCQDTKEGRTMAWIVKIPPSPRHRRIRWQVRYQDGPHERSAGIYPTRPEAVAAKHAIERGEPPPTRQEPEPDRATTLFGAYATEVWWPAWNPTHPRSTRSVKTKVNARILPVFGDLPLNQVDADEISRWTHTLAADGLSPSSIRTYRTLLGLSLNAAVTDGYLPHAPTLPAPRTGRLAPVRSGSPESSFTNREQFDGRARARSSPIPVAADPTSHSRPAASPASGNALS